MAKTQEATSTAIAERDPNEVAAFLPTLPAYTVAAPVVAPLPQYPVLRWGKGVRVVGVTKSTEYTGGILRLGQDKSLDEAMTLLGASPATIEHQQSKKRLPYWLLPQFDTFVLCHTVPAKYSPESWQSGIPYTWNDHQGAMNGSHLGCLMFLRELLHIGYKKPLVFSLNRTVISFFVKQGLLRQFEMFNEIEDACKQQNIPMPQYAYYSFALSIGVGDEEEVGSTQTTLIRPPVAEMPSPITADYLAAHHITPQELEVVESYLEILPRWAADAAYKMSLPFPPKEQGEGQDGSES